MENITSKEAVNLLRKVGCSTAVIKHCKAVSNLAVNIARKFKRKGIEVDEELIKIGALLHDIGRSKTHDIDHGVVGSEILHSFNLPNSIIKIVERHIGSGISADEAVKLGLPNRDFIPETLEEKIISYADKLIENHQKISFNVALKRFSDEFGSSHSILKRFKKVHSELGVGE